MKKLLCVLLSGILLFALGACDLDRGSNGDDQEGGTVTIYLTETMTNYVGNDTKSIELTYEEGWENKEEFTATYNYKTGNPDAGTTTVTFKNKCTVMEVPGTLRGETRFDDNGRAISQVQELLSDSVLERTETTYTYDSYGRKLTEESKIYYKDREQPQIQSLTYSYTDTADGSKGVCNSWDTYTLIYDSNYRLISQTATNGDVELSSIENTYDDDGRLVSVITYAHGEKMVETYYTYKAVEVSKEFANRFPQFKQYN